MTTSPDDAAAGALADVVARERLRVVATLIGATGDWSVAEDAFSDACERALRSWAVDGVPDNPGAWLTTTARRRGVDLLRRAGTERRRYGDLARDRSIATAGDSHGEGMVGDVDETAGLPDDRLRLVLTCCHPALPLEARVALTLKVVMGLSVREVAELFLTSEATMGQRLLRARKRIADLGIPYRVPTAAMLPDRLEDALAVVYLAFTRGYAAGDRAVEQEAVRLGRLLRELLPDELSQTPSLRGLLALVLLQHSRFDARIVDGEQVTLEEQDRARWDHAAIAEGLALLETPATSRYGLEAQLAAAHARAVGPAQTDWPSIVSTYDTLLALVDSPVMALSRAVAVGMAEGAAAGLAALDRVADDPRLAGSYLVPAARADLLARAGRTGESVRALSDAVDLAPGERERRALARRREVLASDR